ncbi:hypothetical protein ACQR10_04550 [Bradyrhizobium sp. HKCCYLRH2060]|uniref:hypothetical protein n=1 Tax=Bradyrhizobium sp. HKCCYLRH2060 TaxID=3420743 RepID=UPI003EB90151
MSDELEFQIAKLALGPDDILVLRSSRILTAVSAAELESRIAHRFGLQSRVMVVQPDFELSVVNRSDVASSVAAPTASASPPASQRQRGART